MTTLSTVSDKKALLQSLADKVLQLAKNKGASGAEVNLSDEEGFSVTVRLNEIDTLIYNKDKGLEVTVYFGHKTGSASTTDFSPAALNEVVDAACSIAKFTDEDPCSGLADPSLMATDFPDLSLWHPWEIEPEKAIGMAKICEQQAMSQDKRLFNSEGAWVETHKGFYAYANSHGFNQVESGTTHSLGCSLIAKEGNEMQRDSEFTSGIAFKDLLSLETIAKRCANKTLAKLGARKIPTQKAPVIFMPEEAAGLIGLFISAISGGNLYRKTSFLLDSLGKSVFPDFMQIHESPLLERGLSSSAYDGDGVATQTKHFIKDGVLESYALSHYSAQQLKMQTTGNCGGVFNLAVDTHEISFNDLVKHMDKGLIVTDLMGQGINLVTGDYSRGASGFWVENGEIQFPVHEITIAGNLSTIFHSIIKIANDIDPKLGIKTGSILIDEMTIAGS